MSDQTHRQLDIQFLPIPGGELPRMMSEEAIGYDAKARAIVDPRNIFEDDPPYVRKTLADFENEPTDKRYRDRVVSDPDNPDRYGIAIAVGEVQLVGLGFCTAMKHPGFYFMAPRSGLSSLGIRLVNSPGTIDADY